MNWIGDNMNYRALEDLINILVKKAGYELEESVTLEDINILNERKQIISNKIEELSKRISNEDYLDKDIKGKDIDEKKYLEDNIESVKTQDEGDLTNLEIKSLEEQIKYLDLKINNKDYKDYKKEEIDNLLLNTLDEEEKETEEKIDDKRKTASLIGLELLEDYKAGKTIKDVKAKLDLLVEKATKSYELTVDEIEEANIFELMDEYSKKKNDIFQKLEKNEYDDKNLKLEINKKCKYHHNKIDSLKETLNAIDNRKKELMVLITESKEFYDNTLNERKEKEENLLTYLDKFNSLVNLEVYKEEFNRFVDYLREEIAKNKYLENKYNEDILSYKNEIRNLEINAKNINSLILEEEKCLEVLNDKLEELENNNIDKINDEITYLAFVDRLEKLSNEQQYYYVDINVIKNEIISTWNKEDDSSDSISNNKEINSNINDDENKEELKNETKLEEAEQDEAETLNLEEDNTQNIEEIDEEEGEFEFLE